MTKIAAKARTKLSRQDHETIAALSEDVDILKDMVAARGNSTPCPREVDYRQSIRRRIEAWNSMRPMFRLPQPKF